MRAAALSALAAAFALTLVGGPWGDERVSDLFLYRTNAAAFLEGLLPYRDVPFEYPPLAAPLMALAGLAGTGEESYRLAFAGLALALAAAVVLLTGALAARTGADRRTALLAAALMPLATGAMLRTHFDLAPLALTLAALVLLCDGRPRAGFAVLGLGVMTKGFPLVVAPVALAWLLARGERRAALAGALSLALTVVALAGVSAALSAQGALDAVTYHVDRPVQVESVPASALVALDALGARTARSVAGPRSDGLAHPLDGALTGGFALLLLAAIALCARAASRPGAGARELVLPSLAAVAAFAALGKVLSPQFMIWLVPLAALALGWRMRALAATAAAAIALTLVEFPSRYADVVAREPAALALVALRNAVLLGALALALSAAMRPASTGAGAARSRWPARRRPPRPAPR
ncbi:MAG: glycosyltransferase 87 family protein [Thermoleophilaceae bacterium]